MMTLYMMTYDDMMTHEDNTYLHFYPPLAEVIVWSGEDHVVVLLQ